MSSNANREMVYCHQCEEEWFKDEHGLKCPTCQSEFVEVIESNNDPRAAPTTSARDTLHDHNPWGRGSAPAPDPEEDDISQYERTRRNMEARRQQRMPFPFMPGMMSPFPPPHMGGMSGIGGPPPPMQSMFDRPLNMPRRGSDHSRSRSAPGNRNGSSPRPGDPSTVRMFGNMGPHGGFSFSYSSSGGFGPPNGEFGGPNELPPSIAQLFQTISGRDPRRGPDPFSALLSNVLNGTMGFPRGTHLGDFASDQNLDQIISQLMEQHASGQAPGPASQAAIQALGKKPATKQLLGGEDEGECSICQDVVKIGDPITELPCHHWFTPACIEAWLKEHDTCPICRKGIMPKEGEPGAVRRADQEPLHDEDPASVARRQSGTLQNPIYVPESPSANRRRRHSASHHGGLRRHSSHDQRANPPRVPGSYPSNSGGGSQRGNNSGGGGGGLLERARNMFSGGSGGGSSRR
ncbi:MAG: hypothetical protein Q9162_002530 [Coniocarpon cinnabarinum]